MDTEYRQNVFNECLSPSFEPSNNRYTNNSKTIPGRNRKAYEDDSLLVCDDVLSGVKPRNVKRNVLTELQDYPKISPKRRLIFTRLHSFTSSEIIILTDSAVRI
jgi:hypothetical protein